MSGNENDNKIPLEEPQEPIEEVPAPAVDDRNMYMTNEPLTNNLESSFGR